MSDHTEYELEVLAAVRALGAGAQPIVSTLTGAELVGEGHKTEILIHFIDNEGMANAVEIPLYSGMFRDSRGQMPPPSEVAELLSLNMRFPPW
jgi:hypothetical protein